MKEVYPGIFLIKEKGLFSFLKPPVNIYVITGEDGLVFDGGYGSFCSIRQFSKQYEEIERICKKRGVNNKINRILLSHCHADHFSGLLALKKKYGFKILLTERMAELIKSSESYRKSYTIEKKKSGGSLCAYLFDLFSKALSKIEYLLYSSYWGINFVPVPDIVITENWKIFINNEQWEIFHSPGHSDDHITLYNREKGVLFSGDNVMKSINVWLGPPRSNLADYEKSLEFMLTLPEISLILPAHGSSLDNPTFRIREILQWRKKRTEDVYRIISDSGENGITLKEIIWKLYPYHSKIKRDFARGWVELTIEELQKSGEIEINGINLYKAPAKLIR